MNMEWYDWVGMLGTLMVLAAFFLLQAGRVSGTGIVYQLLNLFGAGGVLVSLLGQFNVSVFFLELAWMLISAYGIARSFKARANPTTGLINPQDAAIHPAGLPDQIAAGSGQALTILQNNCAVRSASYTAECASSLFQSMPAACTARASTVCP